MQCKTWQAIVIRRGAYMFAEITRTLGGGARISKVTGYNFSSGKMQNCFLLVVSTGLCLMEENSI